MTITTGGSAANPSAMSHRSSRYALWLLSPGFMIGGVMIVWSAASRRSGKRALLLPVSIAVLVGLLLTLPSCSGVSNSGGGGGGGGGGSQSTPPGTYAITVTGASSAVPADAGQSTQVTLVVN
jgi:hypothetical protein